MGAEEQRISLNTLWFGTLCGASLSGALLLFVAICDGIAVFSAVLCGTGSDLVGSPRGAEPP